MECKNRMTKSKSIAKAILRYLAFLSLFLSTPIAHAMIIDVSPGFAASDNGKTQTLLLQTSPQNLGNTYVAANDWQYSFAAQFFLGKSIYTWKNLQFNLGATLGYVNSIMQNGIVDQLSLPNFDNLNYRYNLESISAMGTLNILFDTHSHWQPYLTTSLGCSRNEASDYQETPRILGAVAMAPYASNSTYSFAYSLGTGLRYRMTKIFSIGLGYQFSDFGNEKLGVSPAQQTTETLSLQHFFVNEVLADFVWKLP